MLLFCHGLCLAFCSQRKQPQTGFLSCPTKPAPHISTVTTARYNSTTVKTGTGPALVLRHCRMPACTAAFACGRIVLSCLVGCFICRLVWPCSNTMSGHYEMLYARPVVTALPLSRNRLDTICSHTPKSRNFVMVGPWRAFSSLQKRPKATQPGSHWQPVAPSLVVSRIWGMCPGLPHALGSLSLLRSVAKPFCWVANGGGSVRHSPTLFFWPFPLTKLWNLYVMKISALWPERRNVFCYIARSWLSVYAFSASAGGGGCVRCCLFLSRAALFIPK